MAAHEDTIKELFECYSPAGQTDYLNAFPRWCLSAAYLGVHEKYAKTVLTIYKDGDDMDLVRKLVLQREPTNVAMYRYHDIPRFSTLAEKLTGASWKESCYIEYYKEHKTLAPNIAMYCETPGVAYDSANATADFSAADALDLRVLNVIGYGFDAPDQPDAMHFDQKDSTALRKAVRGVFDKIHACIMHFKETDKPITWMHVPEFGCGAFAGNRGYEVRAIFDECWAEFEMQWASDGVKADRGYIYQDGDFFNNNLRMATQWREYAKTAEHGGLANRLFINAWDPHSLVGNANFTDASMDGYYGRCTAMALLCWPPTNPHVNQQLLAVDEYGLPVVAAPAPVAAPEATAPGAASPEDVKVGDAKPAGKSPKKVAFQSDNTEKPVKGGCCVVS